MFKYFQQAAQHALLRKKAVHQDWAGLVVGGTEPTIDPLLVVAATEFYGQRPWRASRLSLDPTEMKTETDGLAGLLKRDRFHVDLTVNNFKKENHLTISFFVFIDFLSLRDWWLEL